MLTTLALDPTIATGCRGVFRNIAAEGVCVLQSVTSRGTQYMRWEMPEAAYRPELVDFLWDLLNAADPAPGNLRRPSQLADELDRGKE